MFMRALEVIVLKLVAIIYIVGSFACTCCDGFSGDGMTCDGAIKHYWGCFDILTISQHRRRDPVRHLGACAQLQWVGKVRMLAVCVGQIMNCLQDVHQNPPGCWTAVSLPHIL